MTIKEGRGDNRIVLKQPQKWEQFIIQLRANNKNLRALQEELRSL